MDINELIYKVRLNPEKEIERPPTVLSIVEQQGTQSIYIPLFSSGDLSLLQGRQKSKKTYLTSALAVGLLNPDRHDKLKTFLKYDSKIAYFDTEQSDYYAQRTNQRIHKVSGSKNYDFFAMRSLSPMERKEVIEYYCKTEPKCEFIFIDGIVDLLYDFNDLKECSELIQWIMKLTKETQVHCLNILHENNSDGKARGHIGTMLAQKAETVLRIEKNVDEPERSTISAKDTRGRQFQDFDIRIDMDGLPQFSDTKKEQSIF